MVIGWREELKETEQTRALSSVYTLMHNASHFALLVATLVLFFFLLLRFYTVFNTIVNLNVCSLAIFRFVIKMHFFSYKYTYSVCMYV